MAPERFEGKADARSDVYAVGLTLYELLALRPPFDGTDRAGLIGQITTQTPPPLDTLAPDLPRDLETIVHKAMARDPAARYASAADLADDLHRFLENRPIKARRASAAERFRRWCRRNPGVASLAAVTALLLLVIAIGGVVFSLRVGTALGGAGAGRHTAPPGPAARAGGTGEIAGLPGPGKDESVGWSPDGRFLVVGAWPPDRLQVYRMEGDKPVLALEEPTGHGTGNFSPDGRRLVTMSRAGLLRV